MSASHPLWNGMKYDAVTGCWNWIHYKNKKGYGWRWYMGQKQFVHRIAAHLWLGFDLKSTLLVLHRCDNPSCYNPKHLFIGTALMNSRDAIAKGRHLGQPGMDPNRTQCKNGHPWVVENIYRGRACKTCRYLRTKESRIRRRNELNSQRSN
jgi:hypothetical protein